MGQRRSLLGAEPHAERVVHRRHHQVIAAQRSHLDRAANAEKLHGLGERLRANPFLAKDLASEFDSDSVALVERRDRPVAADRVKHALPRAGYGCGRAVYGPLILAIHLATRRRYDDLGEDACRARRSFAVRH
jgi:hypothetical protein